MILDSSFLIDLLRNNPQAVDKAKEFDTKFILKSISIVSVMEIWRGVIRRGTESYLQKVEKLIDSLRVHTINKEVAIKAAEIEAILLDQGEIIDWEDILIAATALIHNEPILTRNVKHFSRISGVKVESY